MNTAGYRKKAWEYEEKHDWKNAAKYYDKAIESYPTIGQSELRRSDLENLKRLRKGLPRL